MKHLLTLLAGLLVTACSSTDLSAVSPFSEAANRSMALQRTAYLKQLNEGLIFGDGISFLGMPTFELTDRKPQVINHELRSGTRLFIHGIQDEVLVDGRSQVAYGTASLDDGTEVDFAYRWGFLGTIRRAPWERTAVSEYRKLSQGEQVGGGNSAALRASP